MLSSQGEKKQRARERPFSINRVCNMLAVIFTLRPLPFLQPSTGQSLSQSACDYIISLFAKQKHNPDPIRAIFLSFFLFLLFCWLFGVSGILFNHWCASRARSVTEIVSTAVKIRRKNIFFLEKDYKTE